MDDMQRWIRRMRACVEDCPAHHWLFASETGLHLMSYAENDERAVLPCGGMDQEAIVATFSGPEIDGGAW